MTYEVKSETPGEPSSTVSVNVDKSVAEIDGVSVQVNSITKDRIIVHRKQRLNPRKSNFLKAVLWILVGWSASQLMPPGTEPGQDATPTTDPFTPTDAAYEFGFQVAKEAAKNMWSIPEPIVVRQPIPVAQNIDQRLSQAYQQGQTHALAKQTSVGEAARDAFKLGQTVIDSQSRVSIPDPIIKPVPVPNDEQMNQAYQQGIAHGQAQAKDAADNAFVFGQQTADSQQRVSFPGPTIIKPAPVPIHNDKQMDQAYQQGIAHGQAQAKDAADNAFVLGQQTAAVQQRVSIPDPIIKPVPVPVPMPVPVHNDEQMDQAYKLGMIHAHAQGNDVAHQAFLMGKNAAAQADSVNLQKIVSNMGAQMTWMQNEHVRQRLQDADEVWKFATAIAERIPVQVSFPAPVVVKKTVYVERIVEMIVQKDKLKPADPVDDAIAAVVIDPRAEFDKEMIQRDLQNLFRNSQYTDKVIKEEIIAAKLVAERFLQNEGQMRALFEKVDQMSLDNFLDEVYRLHSAFADDIVEMSTRKGRLEVHGKSLRNQLKEIRAMNVGDQNDGILALERIIGTIDEGTGALDQSLQYQLQKQNEANQWIAKVIQGASVEQLRGLQALLTSSQNALKDTDVSQRTAINKIIQSLGASKFQFIGHGYRMTSLLRPSRRDDAKGFLQDAQKVEAENLKIIMKYATDLGSLKSYQERLQQQLKNAKGERLKEMQDDLTRIETFQPELTKALDSFVALHADFSARVDKIVIEINDDAVLLERKRLTASTDKEIKRIIEEKKAVVAERDALIETRNDLQEKLMTAEENLEHQQASLSSNVREAVLRERERLTAESDKERERMLKEQTALKVERNIYRGSREEILQELMTAEGKLEHLEASLRSNVQLMVPTMKARKIGNLWDVTFDTKKMLELGLVEHDAEQLAQQLNAFLRENKGSLPPTVHLEITHREYVSLHPSSKRERYALSVIGATQNRDPSGRTDEIYELQPQLVMDAPVPSLTTITSTIVSVSTVAMAPTTRPVATATQSVFTAHQSWSSPAPAHSATQYNKATKTISFQVLASTTTPLALGTSSLPVTTCEVSQPVVTKNPSPTPLLTDSTTDGSTKAFVMFGETTRGNTTMMTHQDVVGEMNDLNIGDLCVYSAYVDRSICFHEIAQQWEDARLMRLRKSEPPPHFNPTLKKYVRGETSVPWAPVGRMKLWGKEYTEVSDFFQHPSRTLSLREKLSKSPAFDQIRLLKAAEFTFITEEKDDSELQNYIKERGNAVQPYARAYDPLNYLEYILNMGNAFAWLLPPSKPNPVPNPKPMTPANPNPIATTETTKTAKPDHDSKKKQQEQKVDTEVFEEYIHQRNQQPFRP